MFNVIPPPSVWSLWLFLSIYEKLLIGALGALSVYVLFTAVTTAICVRNTRASIREAARDLSFFHDLRKNLTQMGTLRCSTKIKQRRKCDRRREAV